MGGVGSEAMILLLPRPSRSCIKSVVLCESGCGHFLLDSAHTWSFCDLLQSVLWVSALDHTPASLPSLPSHTSPSSSPYTPFSLVNANVTSILNTNASSAWLSGLQAGNYTAYVVTIGKVPTTTVESAHSAAVQFTMVAGLCGCGSAWVWFGMV